jgi:Magnesium chelatase, subunit ChlI
MTPQVLPSQMGDAGSYGFCNSLLDELPEFDARSLEVLRQPLEDKQVTNNFEFHY